MEISKALLKAACWTWKEWHQKQGLSTFNISGNVTVPPTTSAEGCCCSQRCLLNSMKYLSQLNVSLKLFLSTDENRSSHLCFVPERSLRTSEGDTATLDLMQVLKNWRKFLSGDRAKTQTSVSPILKSLQIED